MKTPVASAVLAVVLAAETGAGENAGHRPAVLSAVREVSVAADFRPRGAVARRHRFLMERQPYVSHWNFMHLYTDRPLFEDVSLRGSSDLARAEFDREVDILKWSGFDGFGSIDYESIFRSQLRMLAERPIEGYSQMLVLTGMWENPRKGSARYEKNKRLLQMASNSPSAERIDGKPVVWVWGSRTERQLEWVRALRADPEVPPFFFFGDVPFLTLYAARGGNARRVAEIPKSVCDKYRAELAECLREFDGLQMRWVDCLRDDSEYGYQRLTDPLYVKYVLPLTFEVLARPEFKNRRVGGYVLQSYANPFNGPVHEQMGTGMLRAYLDAALMCDPDYLVGFEWNEANENTSFQPTVSSGGALARVCAYYRSVLNRETPKPRPGDDVSVPNLILSGRQSLRLGETCDFELLFVPDGTRPKPYRARIVLRDLNGRALGCLPWESLPVEKLTAFSYRVPSERFAGEPAVVPVVEVESEGRCRTYEGFDCVRLRTSTEWNYLNARQCLRELIEPVKVDFSVSPAAGGAFAVAGSLKAEEPLSSLEILDGCEEIAAADREGEFDRSKYDLFRGSFVAMREVPRGDGTADVVGSRGWKLRSAFMAWNSFNASPRADGTPQRISVGLCWVKATFLLAVPKEETPGAKLRLDIPSLGEAQEFPLGDLLRRGQIAHTYPQNVRLELERMDVLGDYPKPLEAREAAVAVTVPSLNRHPVYQLRAVTKSGRLWRSAPIAPNWPAKAGRSPVTVHSASLRKPVRLRLPEELVTDLDYDFANDGSGDWLRVKNGDRHFDAKLGGGWVYAEPFYQPDNVKGTPSDYVTSVPGRVIEDGGHALSFDGRGQYVVLPIEAIPNSAEWNLDCELKPADAENRVLFRMHHSLTTDTSFRLVVEDGALTLAFVGRDERPRHFKTGLRPIPGRWNRLTVERRAADFVCTLNGRSKTFACPFRAFAFQSCVIGANVMPGDQLPKDIKPFKGLVRALRIRHGAAVK